MTEFGIQMYSLRDITKADMDKALREIARMGYKTAEFAGFFGYKAEYIKGLLDEYGIKAVGTHTGVGDLINNFEGTVAYHKAIGCKDIIIPGASIYDRKGIEEFIENVNRWIPLLKAEGLTLHYHNHDGEFKEVADGFVPHDELAARTELKFEIDTYWAYVAGRDPIEVMEYYGDRVEFIHLKDGFADRTGKSLGLGTAPVAEVLDYAVKHGKKIVVESEGLEPTGLQEVERCIDYLKTSGK
ncbi:MAG: sugar phosphate isomerase/epimerase [Clostridia bacterium]|nr:sugar phosphate isomerase/epimerase [Clostridia bacterium]